MSILYPREKREIIVINGIWDPCVDTGEMSRLFSFTGDGWHAAGYGIVWSRVTAPGGVGGYAHKLLGEIDNDINGYGVGGLSPYRNGGFRGYYSFSNPLKWKMIADFRIRIAQDQDGGSGVELSHCAGFELDGCTQHIRFAMTCLSRARVQFNVASGYIGITKSNPYNHFQCNVVYKKTKSLSYNTWYDVHLEWERDWWVNPEKLTVTCFINKIQEFSEDVDIEDWRHLPINEAGNLWGKLSYNGVLGRCGPSITVENDGGVSNGLEVEAYFKDIHITLEHNITQWEYSDSLIGMGNPSEGEFLMRTTEELLGEGDDIIIHRRETTSDNWVPLWRGIVRHTSKPRTKLTKISAEGWGRVLLNEKTKSKTYTAQTADYIVKDILTDPPKLDFDTSTFIDSTTTTYNRTYINIPKMDILSEMGGLENFILYVDHENAWHFESYLKNPTSIHLIWGQSKIIDAEVDEVFIRQPNLIRVVGSGVRAEREIGSVSYQSGTLVVRQINRLELTTQTQVDDALDYYISLYREPLQIMELRIRTNYNIKKGNLITVTVPHKGVINRRFLVVTVTNTNTKRMTLSLLEAKPHLAMLISDLSKRADREEGKYYPDDDITTNPVFSLEGIATVLVDGYFELEYDSEIVRTGKVTITNGFLDDLVEVWNEETPTQPTHVAYGTGTNPPQCDDTALQTETSRVSATVSRKERIGYSTFAYFQWYRAVEYSIDVSNPSGVTEIGLLNAAAGGTLACRAIFDSYTQTGSVTFRIRLRIAPKPGPSFVTVKGIADTNDWMYNGTQNWSANELNLCHFATSTFTGPEPYSFFASGLSDIMTWHFVPDDQYGTFTKTKLLTRHMIKYQRDYADYDHTECDSYHSTQCDPPAGFTPEEVCVSLVDEIPNTTPERACRIIASIFHRSNIQTEDYDGNKCRWVFFIRFEQGWIEYT